MADDMSLLDTPDAPAEAAAVPDSTPAAPAVPDAAAQPAAAPAEAATEPTAPAIEVEYPDGDSETDASPEGAATDKTEAQPETEAASAAANRFGPAALTRALADNQPLAAALEQAPRLKSQLYQMARRSQELAEYQDIVPSIARAKEAIAAQQSLGEIDRAYYSGDPQQFWTSLHEASGQSGAYERQVQFLHKVFLDRLQADAAAAGDSNVTDAVAAIRETLGWGNSRSSRSRTEDGRFAAGEEGNLPPHIRQRLEQAAQNDRELQQLRSRLSDGDRQAGEKFLDDAAGEAGAAVRSFVDGILANTGFSDYDKANIARDFLEQVAELADRDKVHNAQLDELLRAGGRTPETRQQMVRKITQWTRQNGREILEPILKRAGAGLRQRQAARETARAQARPEPAGSAVAAQPTAPNARDLVHQAEAKLKRRLSDREILDLG